MKRYCFLMADVSDELTDEDGDGLRSFTSVVEAVLHQTGPVLYEVKPGFQRRINQYDRKECASKALKILARYEKGSDVIFHLAARIATDVSIFWGSPREKIFEYLRTGNDDLREEILDITRKEGLAVTGFDSDAKETVQRAELISNAIYSMQAALSRGYIDKDRDFSPINSLRKALQCAGLVWYSMGADTREQKKSEYNEWLEEAFLK